MAIRRAAAVKPPAIKIVNPPYKEPHAHGCLGCKGRYVDNCPDSHTNALCRPCSGRGEAWELLRVNRLARDCCRLHSQPVTKEQLRQYSLSPGCDWFICTACARTFPFSNPGREHS